MTPSKVKIEDLANFILYYYIVNKDRGVTNLELQKVLYYLQAYHLTFFDKAPLFDEEPEAWVRGPVYRAIYNEYKAYGAEEIEMTVGDKKEEYEQALNKLNLTAKQIDFMQSALSFFTNMTYGELITRTHNERPWNEARKGLGTLDYSDAKITHDMMYNYYSEIVKKQEEKSDAV